MRSDGLNLLSLLTQWLFNKSVASWFGWALSLKRYFSLKFLISSFTEGIWRSCWITQFGTNHGAKQWFLELWTGNVQFSQCWRCLLFPIVGIRIARLVLELPYISVVCCQLTVENYGLGSNTFVWVTFKVNNEIYTSNTNRHRRAWSSNNARGLSSGSTDIESRLIWGFS
jgi:hypothetical protein